MPIRSCSRATLERARCNYSRIPVGDDISPCFGLSGASARWQNMKSRHAAALSPGRLVFDGAASLQG